MVLTWTHGIVSVLLNHTRTRGTSVARMRDFLKTELKLYCRTQYFNIPSSPAKDSTNTDRPYIKVVGCLFVQFSGLGLVFPKCICPNHDCIGPKYDCIYPRYNCIGTKYECICLKCDCISSKYYCICNTKQIF